VSGLPPAEAASPPGRATPSRVVLVDARSRVSFFRRAPGPDALFVGWLSGEPWWAEDAEADEEEPASEPADPDIRGVGLRELRMAVDESLWALAGRAAQLLRFRAASRFCGWCGRPTRSLPDSAGRACEAGHPPIFPPVSPAIITLVERADGRALLARHARSPQRFSCIAGFVEPGESLEDAVRREVREEVGVAVGALAYRGSEPWPFPHSLMVGFSSSAASERIDADGTEIAEAGWFSPGDLPALPPAGTISRALIDDWRARVEGSVDPPAASG